MSLKDFYEENFVEQEETEKLAAAYGEIGREAARRDFAVNVLGIDPDGEEKYASDDDVTEEDIDAILYGSEKYASDDDLFLAELLGEEEGYEKTAEEQEAEELICQIMGVDGEEKIAAELLGDEEIKEAAGKLMEKLRNFKVRMMRPVRRLGHKIRYKDVKINPAAKSPTPLRRTHLAKEKISRMIIRAKKGYKKDIENLKAIAKAPGGRKAIGLALTGVGIAGVSGLAIGRASK